MLALFTLCLTLFSVEAIADSLPIDPVKKIESADTLPKNALNPTIEPETDSTDPVPLATTTTALGEQDPSEDDVVERQTPSLDPLAFTQKELQSKFTGGIALNVGPAMPWSEYGASFFWTRRTIVQSLSLGAGSFEFSDNYNGRNFRVKTNSQSAYYAARWFFLGFGPLYLEPFVGLVRWTGNIRPNGYDNENDQVASSLNSRFDMKGVSVGANLGLMWIFGNGIFLDYNLMNLSISGFMQQNFTTNTEEAKRSVRKELGGPLTMSNLHLRVGYQIAL